MINTLDRYDKEITFSESKNSEEQYSIMKKEMERLEKENIYLKQNLEQLNNMKYPDEENNSILKITSKVMKPKALTKFGFNFNEMGVGGLDQEISNIFRRAFTTRLYPAAYLEKYGIHHVKGILLYGPPGTGKTLIARTLANALNVKEFKVVNGPELFDKYVGETEKKIRDLFANAEKDQKDNGDDAGLHVIVFDEIELFSQLR